MALPFFQRVCVRVSEREREKRVRILTTSLIFMLMHFDACCFSLGSQLTARLERRGGGEGEGGGKGGEKREKEERKKQMENGDTNLPA